MLLTLVTSTKYQIYTLKKLFGGYTFSEIISFGTERATGVILYLS